MEWRSEEIGKNPRHAQRGARIVFDTKVLSMPFRFFTVPIQNIAEAEAELNTFLGSYKVLAVDRQWVDQGAIRSGPSACTTSSRVEPLLRRSS